MFRISPIRSLYLFLGLSILFLAGCSSVNIIRPLDREAFNAGQAIQFKGEITRSLETGGADRSDNLRWESSIDGHIGDGIIFSTDILSVGIHGITASWPNHTREDSILIWINP
jgi:hypothetical protein